MLILFVLLLISLTNQIDYYVGKAESACFFNQSSIYFNFTVASYDPPLLDLKTELIIIENVDLCSNHSESF